MMHNHSVTWSFIFDPCHNTALLNHLRAYGPGSFSVQFSLSLHVYLIHLRFLSSCNVGGYIYPLPLMDVFDTVRWHGSLMRQVTEVSSWRQSGTNKLLVKKCGLKWNFIFWFSLLNPNRNNNIILNVDLYFICIYSNDNIKFLLSRVLTHQKLVV